MLFVAFWFLFDVARTKTVDTELTTLECFVNSFRNAENMKADNIS